MGLIIINPSVTGNAMVTCAPIQGLCPPALGIPGYPHLEFWKNRSPFWGCRIQNVDMPPRKSGAPPSFLPWKLDPSYAIFSNLSLVRLHIAYPGLSSVFSVFSNCFNWLCCCAILRCLKLFNICRMATEMVCSRQRHLGLLQITRWGASRQ